MSQFLSDLLNFATASAIAAAVGVGYLPQGDPDMAQPEVVAEFVVAEPVRQVVDLTQIPEAELLSVTFASAGDTIVPPTDVADVSNSSARGTVTGQAVNLRAGPGTGFAVVARAVRADTFAVTGQRDGIWIEIVAPGQQDPVWIHGNYFDAPET